MWRGEISKVTAASGRLVCFFCRKQLKQDADPVVQETGNVIQLLIALKELEGIGGIKRVIYSNKGITN